MYAKFVGARIEMLAIRMSTGRAGGWTNNIRYAVTAITDGIKRI